MALRVIGGISASALVPVCAKPARLKPNLLTVTVTVTEVYLGGFGDRGRGKQLRVGFEVPTINLGAVPQCVQCGICRELYYMMYAMYIRKTMAVTVLCYGLKICSIR